MYQGRPARRPAHRPVTVGATEKITMRTSPATLRLFRGIAKKRGLGLAATFRALVDEASRKTADRLDPLA